MISIDSVIEEYRKKMLITAKENGIDSHLTLIASQNLDQLLNIKMNKKSVKLTKKRLNNFLLHQ
ncbi:MULTISPECIES: aspartyl-phosphate phosphatase Spo0E family protein [Metabacillus]|uniref:Aspartyl-phosphate phosphatase Spo0E family protein n=2 Tax=Metabacillus TaxID=2675233 RepID=A0A179T039_9BACI|nr:MULTISPECIES: aspartyl-phosphate phosphatase Spo0E family protein [Metabacillus]OAS86740.1 hypothetical protein A6K24_04315 [Metabacillus litoralis]QNF29189.1 aspartyl-phosphate phosphatase Spo0E family protein [Metabacillus sp. KUDC1714]